ncbi:hypothetical protein [Streptomyces sp. YKOK-I1]
MTTRRINAVLLVDLGEGREIKHGDRAGQIRWDRLPRARYDCLLCGASETPDGRGPGDIARFVADIRTSHTCRTQEIPEAA